MPNNDKNCADPDYCAYLCDDYCCDDSTDGCSRGGGGSSDDSDYNYDPDTNTQNKKKNCCHVKRQFFSNESKTYIEFSITYGIGFANGFLGQDTVRANVLRWEKLCNHSKKAQPLTASELKLAFCFVVCNCAEQSPQRRQRILKNLERLLLRMRNSAAHFVKAAADDPESVDALEYYRRFLRDLKSVAFHYLTQKTANFNRRISALTIVKVLYGEMPAENDFDLRTHFRMFDWLESSDIEALLARLDDNFQLCQEAAFDILIALNVDETRFDPFAFVADAKRRLYDATGAINVPSNFRVRLVCAKFPAEIPRLLRDILSLCREILIEVADGADGGASLLALVERSPYILLASIADVLTVHFRRQQAAGGIGDMLEEIDRLCYQFAAIVSPVCHDLSPEGYLPTECLTVLAGPNAHLEMMARLHTNFAQRLLVCCWRTHKCVSSILGLIASEASYPDEIDASVLQRTGDYLWLQLTECRHRGAFECAAQAFRDVCARLWAIQRALAPMTGDAEPLVTPMVWLRRVIDALSGGQDVGNLCSTRRSAGLPHLVSVILSTAKVKRNFPHLDDTLNFLLSCRRLEPKLEVHCVNVLKVLFANSMLADGVGAHVETALRVCYDGYRSSDWAVRNAHSQFFTALVRRIFGIPRSAERTLHVPVCNRLTSHHFFSRHPSIYCVLMENVNLPAAGRPHFTIFPVLVFLTHLQPSTSALEAHFPLAAFTPGVMAIMLESPLQKIRELASVALVAVADEQLLLKILRSTLEQICQNFGCPPQNQIDGLLSMINAMAQQNLFDCSTFYGKKTLSIASQLLDRLLDGLLECRNDFNLSTALTLICQIGDESLKRSSLSRVLDAGWHSHVDEGDGGDCVRLASWRSAARPIGTLIADQPASTQWQQISRATVTSSLGALSSVIGIALAEIRWESYRAFLLADLPIPSESKMAIYADLICDLYQYNEEHRLKTVIALLARERKHITKLKTTITYEDIDRCEEICERNESCLNLLRLRFAISQTAGEWLERADALLTNILTEDDDERTRMAALRFIEDHLDEDTEQLLATACLALKDELPTLRHYASKFLSSRLLPLATSVTLNTEFCWSLALERFPHLPSRLSSAASNESDDDALQLFRASRDNIFAEMFGIYEFDRVKELLIAKN